MACVAYLREARRPGKGTVIKQHLIEDARTKFGPDLTVRLFNQAYKTVYLANAPSSRRSKRRQVGESSWIFQTRWGRARRMNAKRLISVRHRSGRDGQGLCIVYRATAIRKNETARCVSPAGRFESPATTQLNGTIRSYRTINEVLACGFHPAKR